mmetsp:Transcript_22403/g.56541  ORF Transcript_22403/g.56541 Transcript_22403/m.56541 type:complete len:222 (-) Transcript_22403:1342-2007(-)
MTKSKKPGWLLVTPGFCLSMRKDTFIDMSVSTSPWRHISSSSRTLHLTCTSLSAKRCPVSASLMAACRTSVLRDSEISPPSLMSSSGFSSRFWRSLLSLLTMAMCSAMSVARTMSMTILRTACCCWWGILWRKSQSGWRRRRNAADRWWCSLGDLSLESMAQSSVVLIKKSLLKPLCSKSWMVAAKRAAKISSLPTKRSRPPLRRRQWVDCTTSATWVALW